MSSPLSDDVTPSSADPAPAVADDVPTPPPSTVADAPGTSFFPRAAAPSPRQVALARAVVELEEYVAARGWDAPVRVYALVRTAAALEADPSLAQILDERCVAEAAEDPELLTTIEQEHLPEAADLEDLVVQLAWPETVDGVALSVERSVLPPEAEDEAAAIEDPTERLAYLASRTDLEDVRMVVGVLRSGESWCALRARSRDEAARVAQGSRLVPGLTDALASTLV